MSYPLDRANLMADVAAAMIANQQTDEARSVLLDALKIHPTSTRARFALIDVYRTSGMLEESLPLLIGLIEYDLIVRYNYATALADDARDNLALVLASLAEEALATPSILPSEHPDQKR